MPIVQPLVGRDDVLQFLDGRIAAARDRSSSSAVVLAGEAGIGKSALLEYCRAAAAGFTILAACGVAAEEHLSFAILYDLLNPIMGLVDRLPPRQAEVIKGALTVGPATEAGRFEVAAAVLSLLASAAEDGPLLILVDDAAQWVDESSLGCLTFAARRLHAESIIALFALRVGISSHQRESSAAAALQSLEYRAIGRLSRDNAARLLKRRHPDLPPDRLSEILAQAMGNPLAISVLSRSRASDLGASDELDDRLMAAFRHDVAGLNNEARLGVETMAVAGDGIADQLHNVLRQLGLDLDCLAEAEEANLVRQVSGQFVFSHPLIRIAVSSTLPGPRLRHLHRAVARVLEVSPAVADQERRLWHLVPVRRAPMRRLQVKWRR